MFGGSSKSKDSGPGFFRRVVRTLVSIIVLSALVLSISYFIKELSVLDAYKIANLAGRVGVDEQKVGEVAGNFAKRVSDTNLGLNDVASNANSSQNEVVVAQDIISSKNTRATETEYVLKVAIFADSHSDLQNLTKALSDAAGKNVMTIVHLGDHTDLGVFSALEETKKVMDTSTVPYYAIPGDRDLWKSEGSTNFAQVFGETFHTITLAGFKLLVLDNSALNSVIPDAQFMLFKTELEDADFVFLSQPLYHPSSNKIMGIVDGEEIILVKKQADELLSLVRNSNVKAVIAAEHHISSENTDPQKFTLKHITVGAITSTINGYPQKGLQSSRFSILRVTSDGTFDIEQVIL